MLKALVVLASLSTLSLTSALAEIPTIEVTPQTGDPMGNEAVSFMDQYFQHLSSPEALDHFQDDYPAFTDYYGKITPKDVIMREKAQFVHRWPERTYQLRPDSIAVACDDDDKMCRVTGLVDFACRSLQRQAMSTGVARFTATIWFDDRPQVIGEYSRVIE